MSEALESIEQRLRKLEDIEAIRRLRMQYHHYVNEGLANKMPSLFTTDAKISFGYVGGATGSEEIGKFFEAAIGSRKLIKQFPSNHMVDVDGDRGNGLAYMDARYAQGDDSVMVAARFTETYVRQGGQWKIESMECESFFSVPITEGWAGDNINQAKPVN